ncbi:MAG: hypothetical protein ACYTEZ_08465 [Planctomycetota bacterium]|jgi:hypothetical protein
MSEERAHTAERKLGSLVSERTRGLITQVEGHDRGVRVECHHEVVVGGPNGAFAARAVNISRSGVLLALKYGDHVVDGAARVGFAQVVRGICAAGAELRFEGLGFTLAADLVRAADGDPETEGEQVLACRFHRPLTDEQCAVFSIPMGDAGD